MASARRTGTNENISTYGNGTRNYTALATWEAATDNDLVTATTSEVLECYADSSSFDDETTLAGAVTNSSYFRIIRAASGEKHGGVPGSGVKFDPSSISGAQVFRATENYASFEDFEISFTLNSASNISGIVLSGAESTSIGIIVSNPSNVGAGGSIGIQQAGTGEGSIDCIVFGGDEGFRMAGSNNPPWYNNTAVGNGIGFRELGAGTPIAKNCLASGNTTDFSGTFEATSEANASSDATAPGGGPVTSMTFTFVDADNDDYHLAATDYGAFQRGLDLSADATFAFDDDIDGDTILVWSIGADAQASFISSRRRAIGENVSTYGGGGRDYTALATWEAATDIDLVTAKQSEVLECYADSSEFNDGVTISGATTDTTYFRIVRAATGEEHLGVPGSGVKFNNAAPAPFLVGESNFQLQDLEIRNPSATAINLASGTGIVCSGLIVTSPGGTSPALNVNPTTSAVIVNSVVHGSAAEGIEATATGTWYLYNITVVDNDSGIVETTGDIVSKNCLCTGNTTVDFSGTFDAASSNNSSGDDTAPGSNSRTDQNFAFIDAANADYHIGTNDTGAKAFGIDLSSDGVFPFMDDINGEEITTWSTGFHSDPDAVGVFLVGDYPPHIQGMIIGFKRSWS